MRLCLQANGKNIIGGKLDDITVVVSYVGDPLEGGDDSDPSSNSSSNESKAHQNPPPLSKM